MSFLFYAGLGSLGPLQAAEVWLSSPLHFDLVTCGDWLAPDSLRMATAETTRAILLCSR